MARILIHAMDTLWSTSNAVALQVAIDNQNVYGESTGSNRLTASDNALNAVAEFAPAGQLDLSAFDEICFWLYASSMADGSTTSPFYLEFSYSDAHDNADEEHRWFVAVNQQRAWQQVRIGIERDRRSAITRFRFRCITNIAFSCNIDELLGVHEEMLADLESALVDHLDTQLTLPGLSDVALIQAAQPGDTQVVLPLNQAFHINNRVLIQHGSAGDEQHTVTGIVHDPAHQSTTLTFAADDKVLGSLVVGSVTVSVVVVIVVEAPPLPSASISPSMIITLRDMREDPARTSYISQRDSFRPRGTLLACSTRAGARAYTVDYQATVFAPERAQQVFLQTYLLQRLSIDIPLYVNGAPSPVTILPPPVPTLDERRTGLLAPLYFSIGTHMEIATREEIPFIQRATIDAAPFDTPTDREGIVVQS